MNVIDTRIPKAEVPQEAAGNVGARGGLLTRWLPQSKLFRKYATLLALLVTTALIAASALGMSFLWQTQKAALGRLQKEKATGAANQIAQFVKEIEGQVGWTTHAALVGGTAGAEQRRFDFIRLLRQVPAITELSYIDAAGTEQLRISRLAMDQIASKADLSKDPKFTQARAKRIWTGPVYFHKESEPYMTMAVSGAARSAGVTGAEVNLKFIWDVVSAIQIGRQGQAFVADETGRLIAHPDISLVLRKTDLSKLPLFTQARAEPAFPNPSRPTPEWHTGQDYAGREVLSAHAAIPQLGWTVFVEVPVAEALQPIYEQAKRMAWLVLGGIGLAGLSGLWFAGKLAQPIQALRAGAVQLGSGDLTQRIEVNTGDELEALAGEFNAMAGRLQESYAGLEQKVETRTKELTESLEYQTAISDVLSVIARSPGTVQPVLDTIIETSARLARADTSGIFTPNEDGFYQVAAAYGVSADWLDYVRRYPFPKGRGGLIGRTALEARTVHMHDCLADPEFSLGEHVKVGGFRTMLGIPLLRQGTPIGVIGLTRTRVEPFSDAEIGLVETFASQAVIAIENARLFEAEQTRTKELTESLTQQTATAEVLKTISRSALDLQPVLDALVASASHLCDAPMVAIHVARDSSLPGRARYGFTPRIVQELAGDGARQVMGRGSLAGRTLASLHAVHIPDVDADPEYTFHDFTRITGARSMLGLPLLRDGTPIGLLSLYRTQVRPFTPRQIELMETFADQAVIAIENARLFEAEQTRTKELTESLEYQTAISSVLQVISRSPANLQPVLDTIVATAERLCEADRAQIFTETNGRYRLVAYTNTPAATVTYFEENPIVPSRGRATARALLEGRAIHVPDVTKDPDYDVYEVSTMQGGARLAVPLRSEGRTFGVIALPRSRPLPFTQRQIDLVSVFASQAVIAIENARLFEAEQTRTKELTESLEYQTAISDVLEVISTSPNSLQPVFDTIVATATQLCHGDRAILRRRDGDKYLVVATHGLSETQRVNLMRYPLTADRGSIFGRAALEGRTVHLPDTLADPEFGRPDAPVALGIRSGMAVPLMRDGAVFGVVTVTREAAKAFEPRQIQLLETFARQAVIAIENARLFEAEQTRTKELAESLEYQTATSEVLGVISRSPNELQPVFDAIVATARDLCEAQYALAFEKAADGHYRVTASANADPAFLEWVKDHPISADDGTMVGIAAAERRTVHFPDALAEARFTDRTRQEHSKARTMLGVPLMRAGEAIGVLFLARTVVQPFTQRQIDLVTTFANQAVIAINNVGNFEQVQARTKELSESLEYQTATSEVLGVISKSPNELQPVLDAIVNTADRLCKAHTSIIYLFEGDALVPAAYTNNNPDRISYLRANPTYVRNQPINPLELTPASIAITELKAIHTSDVRADERFAALKNTLTGLHRAAMCIPLMRDGAAIGVLGLYRRVPEAFTPRQVELATTFANQAVIAINNVGNFEEVQARTKELTESLEQQTATGQVLDVISRSPSELMPVLQAICDTAARMCETSAVSIFLREGQGFWQRVIYGLSEEYIRVDAEHEHLPGRDTLVGRVALTGKTQHITDCELDPEYGYKEVTRIDGIHTILGVPLIRFGEVVGVICLARKHVQPFEEKQIDLVTTFASQAVIAISNTRLFEEVQARTKEVTEALEYQTATTEVLKVVSRSTFDLEPVLQSVVETATRLCQADMASIFQLDGVVYRWRVGHGLTKEYGEIEKNKLIATDDKTLVGRTALSGHAIHIEDAWTDAKYGPKDDAKLGSVRTMLGVPLLRHGKPIGVIALARLRVETFTQRQIDLVTTFADQSVIAIENARLLTEVQTRSAELARTVNDLKALSDVGQVVSSTLDQKTVLSTVVERAAQLAGADAGVVFRFDARDRQLDLVETYGFDADMAEAYRIAGIETARSGVREAISERRPIHIPDIAERPPSPLRDLVLGRGYNASLIVPLVAADRTLGTLTILRKRKGEFASGIVSMMQSFASQSAIALQNARLFDEIAEKGRQIEIASQHKSQFLANMSHELRTPLNAILGYAELLVDGTYGQLADKPKGILERVERNGRHLLSLINDVLDLSKIEAGEMTLGIEEYSWGSLVRNVVAATEPLASQKGLKLETDIAEGLPRGSGDARRLNQVLLNLVGNAIKFTDSGSVRIAARAEADNFEISVADTGPGIAAEDQAKVFEKFQQIDNSSTRKKGGSGLGLSISRELVELHGGTISVTSILGQGSTFEIVLPCRVEQPAEATP